MTTTTIITMTGETMSNPTLGSMLRYRRPHGSQTEREFIRRFIAPLARPDAFGNYIRRVGPAPGRDPGVSPVMWSCHTDTVHAHDGTQRITRNGSLYELAAIPTLPDAPTLLQECGGKAGLLRLAAEKRRRDPQTRSGGCLGADCTTGVWLMVRMIQARVPGLYIFHRAEECGGQGSVWIADNTPELFDGVSMAIALDRRGQDSIITHQAGGRCASDVFASSLGEQLTGFTADPTGLFTDTANYTHLIPECTNLSIGYENGHSSDETQDIGFAYTLLDRLIHLDISALVVARNPMDEDEWESDPPPPPGVTRGLTRGSAMRCDYPTKTIYSMGSIDIE